jgi:hypothetical protein
MMIVATVALGVAIAGRWLVFWVGVVGLDGRQCP